MNKEKIIFEKRAKLMLSKYKFNDEKTLEFRLIAAAMKNIEGLGYTFAQETIEKVSYMDKETFMKFYDDVVKMCKETVGAHVKHEPMYPNFPEQVMQASEAELFVNAILHYVFGVKPETEEIERLPLIQDTKLKPIGLSDESEFEKIIKNLIASKTSVSESNRKIIEWALTNEEDVEKFLPKEIHLKENLAFVMGILTNLGKVKPEIVSGYFKTATDILRYATMLSGGDVSLSSNTRFKKFKRSERRLILGMLNSKKSLLDDMIKHQGRWIRLGEILHPGEYAKQYPKAYKAFKVIRNRKESDYVTFNGRVEQAVEKKDLATLVSLLSKRPGEFARRLDKIVRDLEKQSAKLSAAVVEEFKSVIDAVSSPVLIQLIGHFENRSKVESTTREFFPKGQVSKIWIEENKVGEISEQTCETIVDACKDELKRRFAELKPLGKVYLDEDLKGCLIPFSERTASKSLKTYARGSKFDLDENTNFLRMFLYWKQPQFERVDVDMSVAYLNEDFGSMGTVSYSHLRDSRVGIFHSGDITSAPNGASEYIDVDIEKALEQGVRYVTMTAHAFTMTPFCDLPECFVGWMEREDNLVGKVFEPKTVKNKIDISSNLRIIVPIVFDLKERKVFWADMGLNDDKRYARLPNKVERNLGFVGGLTKSITNIKKMDLYDLFDLHIQARGAEVVEEKEEAELIFSREVGITPHDFDIIAGEYLV